MHAFASWLVRILCDAHLAPIQSPRFLPPFGRLLSSPSYTDALSPFHSPETLKKQTQQQQQEYNRLSDELAKATGNVSNKRAD